MSKYLCVNFLIKTSVNDVEYQRAYRFCICKGIFNTSKLATLIPLYKEAKEKVEKTTTSLTLNEKVIGNGRVNGDHKNLYKKSSVSDSGLPATRKTFT